MPKKIEMRMNIIDILIKKADEAKRSQQRVLYTKKNGIKSKRAYYNEYVLENNLGGKS